MTTSNGLMITASVIPAQKPANVNVYITNRHTHTHYNTQTTFTDTTVNTTHLTKTYRIQIITVIIW